MSTGTFDVGWRGLPPDPPLRTTLETAGIALHLHGAHSVVAFVASTARAARVPEPPEAGVPWLWLCREPVSHDRRLLAAQRGAYEVISTTERDAGDQIRARLIELAQPLPQPPPDSTLALSSSAARDVARQVARVAPTSMSVLFTGETGTGKEVMARLTHAWSPRRAKMFVPINCAAIPNELMEAELFGYARGAFSGAVQRYDGQLMAAEGGTVFLDEVDDTSPETQVKLLRVLEDRVVSRLGENEWHQVDFRLLAATNRDLAPLIEAGLFGEDLYERLAIVRIQLPPLRERLEDIPDLVRHFLGIAEKEGLPPKSFEPAAIERLKRFHWPGNIRELENLVRRLSAIYAQDIVSVEMVENELASAARTPFPDAAEGSGDLSESVERFLSDYFQSFGHDLPPAGLYTRILRKVESPLITAALAATRGNQIRAADLLGLNRNTLRKKIRDLGIKVIRTPGT